MILFTVFLLFIAGGSGTGIYFYIMNISQSNIPIDLTISTIGDSLTQGGEWMNTIGYGVYSPDCYQYYVYQYLHVRNLETQVRNLGIGGQTVSQICERFNTTIPSNYTVCMAGTNDLFQANYSDPNVTTVLINHIIETYNDSIFNLIADQQSLGYFSPILIICSIPPTAKPEGGDTFFLNVIRTVNTGIKSYVEGLNRSDILFCDMFTAVSNQTGWMMPGLYKSDGVHFNNLGDQVEGETIAKVICDKYYHNTVI